jgi:hypothetical protein
MNINLSTWLDSRGKFIEFSTGEVELQLVSLSKDLVKGLEALPRYRDMYDFVAEHGLSHNRTRISDDENMCEDLPVIWAIPEFIEAKKDIVDRICELSGITSILADKLEAEEMAALEAEEVKRVEALKEQGHIDGDDLPEVNIDQLNDDEAA